jgi:hypothetical protein
VAAFCELGCESLPTSQLPDVCNVLPAVHLGAAAAGTMLCYNVITNVTLLSGIVVLQAVQSLPRDTSSWCW